MNFPEYDLTKNHYEYDYLYLELLEKHRRSLMMPKLQLFFNKLKIWLQYTKVKLPKNSLLDFKNVPISMLPKSNYNELFLRQHADILGKEFDVEFEFCSYDLLETYAFFKKILNKIDYDIFKSTKINKETWNIIKKV